jgi:Fe-S cluster assembly protein SufD
MTTTQPRQWFLQLLQHAPGADADVALPWLRKARAHAADALAKLPLPDRKQEAWRYTNIDGLLQTNFTPSREELVALQAEDIESWLLEATQSYRVVFANGRFLPALSHFMNLPEGVVIGSVRQALSRDPHALAIWFGQTANHSEDVFTALNTALCNDGLYVHVKPGVTLARPIEVLYLNLEVDAPQLIQPRNVVVLERGARAQLLERYMSTGESNYFHNGVSEILLEDNASLTHLRLQQESRQAYHRQQSFLAQGAQSQYDFTNLSLGGKWARHDLQVRFQAEQAKCQTRGLYLVGDGQLQDHHLNILHTKPGNSSDHHYKGILYGKGRGVFDGRILVGKEAQHTSARLVNNNLLLSREAEIDTKPQLEIHADAVSCSHGTTVSQLDPEQLFYLRSRGIATSLATQLLCEGFAAEILTTLALPSVQGYANRIIQKLLHHVGDNREHIHYATATTQP